MAITPKMNVNHDASFVRTMQVLCVHDDLSISRAFNFILSLSMVFEVMSVLKGISLDRSVTLV